MALVLLVPAHTVEPMMLVMNHLGYAAMVLGNHEFNFGLANMDKARSAAKFPWLWKGVERGGLGALNFMIENSINSSSYRK